MLYFLFVMITVLFCNMKTKLVKLYWKLICMVCFLPLFAKRVHAVSSTQTAAAASVVMPHLPGTGTSFSKIFFLSLFSRSYDADSYFLWTLCRICFLWTYKAKSSQFPILVGWDSGEGYTAWREKATILPMLSSVGCHFCLIQPPN